MYYVTIKIDFTQPHFKRELLFDEFMSKIAGKETTGGKVRKKAD